MIEGCFSQSTSPVSSLWASSLVWASSLLWPAAAPASRPTAAMVTATSVRAASDRDVVEKRIRSEEHTSELQSLMRISYAVFCLKKKNINRTTHTESNT